MEKMCETFKEAKIEEPNWLEVSSKLGLALYGHVSSAELYQVWSKRGPSWMKLFQALQKFDGYQQVAKQAKKKAGVCDACNFISFFTKVFCLTVHLVNFLLYVSMLKNSKVCLYVSHIMHI